MKSGIKCPTCESCLDVVWIMPKRFFHCWLCKEFYNKLGTQLEKINIEEHVSISKESLEELMENYYEKSR